MGSYVKDFICTLCFNSCSIRCHGVRSLYEERLALPQAGSSDPGRGTAQPLSPADGALGNLK